MIGATIDKYTITKKLGEGGMGVVYAAEHNVIRKPVALKLLLPQWTQNKMIVERFVNEATAMGRLAHPNIVAVTDAGQLADGSWFIAMEYLDGGTLGGFGASHGPLSIHVALQILAQVAAGLEAAHKHGIVHRDLKPDNIFLIQQGRNNHFVKILDWGISKLGEGGGSTTRTGMVAGTPAYMAPEQMENLRAADRRSDVFALGVIAYQMVTGGWLPFQDPDRPEEFHNLSAVGIARLIDKYSPVDPRRHAKGLPDGWASAILAAIQKDPQRRPQTARAFALALASATPGDAFQPAGADIIKAYAEELLEIGTLEETVRAVKPAATNKAPARYRFGEQLGAGGMAEVFRATQLGAEGFERAVAVKRVLPGFSNVPQFASMFVTEAKLASLLEHPNIVSIVDFDRDDEGRLFLAMEFVDGRDLAAVSASGRLPFAVTIFVISEVLAGLGYAHELPVGIGPRGVVHRDVSPHNVLVSWEGAVKVSDFGIAKAREATAATASTMIKGKPQYMSPEQANGQALDGRSDLFAVGIMLWELLTGRRLFDGATREVLLQVTLGRIAPPSTVAPDVPPDLEAVTMRLLAVEPNARYANAAEVSDALGRCRDAPRNGRAELVRLLAARFPPDARHPRSSQREMTPQSTVPNRPPIATNQDRAPHPTPAPGWPPHTTLGSAASQVSPSPTRRAPLFVVLGLALAVIGGGGVYIATRHRSATTAASAPDREVTLTIRAEPATASVRVDGVDRGSSPVVVTGAPSTQLAIVVAADGFVTRSAAITLGEDDSTQVVTLERVPAPGSDAAMANVPVVPAMIDAGVATARPVTDASVANVQPDASATAIAPTDAGTSAAKHGAAKPRATVKKDAGAGSGGLDMSDVLD